MKFLWWLSLAVVAYTYLGYPLIIGLLARLRPKQWKREPLPDASVTILMAVHNGAPLLPWKLEHLLTLEPELIREIIIVSDGSTDPTAEILNSTQDPRLKPLILTQQVGKSTALNQALALATSEFILFTDIRPRIEPGAIAALLANFADPRVGCCAGELVVQVPNGEGAAAVSGGLYWRYEQAIRNTEAAFDSPVGVYGGFYMARRALVRPAPDGLILDDMFQPLSIIRQGYRSVVDRTAVVVDTWPAKTEAEFARKVRTLAGNFQLLREAPWTLSLENRVLFQLISHKLLRLAVPYFLILLLLTSLDLALHSAGWALIALAQIVFWALAALAIKRPIPVFSAAGALLVLNAAAVVGLYRFLTHRGPLWKIWNATALPTR